MMPDVVDPIQIGPQLLDLGTKPGQIAERLVETGQEGLKRNQSPYRKAAHGHSEAADPQHGDGRQRRQQRRQREQKGVIGTQVLLTTDHSGLITSPANHQVRSRNPSP